MQQASAVHGSGDVGWHAKWHNDMLICMSKTGLAGKFKQQEHNNHHMLPLSPINMRRQGRYTQSTRKTKNASKPRSSHSIKQFSIFIITYMDYIYLLS